MSPCEILLHTTQAIDLLHKLGLGISAYFKKASAELLEIKSRVEPGSAQEKGPEAGLKK